MTKPLPVPLCVSWFISPLGWFSDQDSLLIMRIIARNSMTEAAEKSHKKSVGGANLWLEHIMLIIFKSHGNRHYRFLTTTKKSFNATGSIMWIYLRAAKSITFYRKWKVIETLFIKKKLSLIKFFLNIIWKMIFFYCVIIQISRALNHT